MTELRRDSMEEEDYGPLDAGWDARIEAVRLSENPYAINNWKHYDWEEGWTLAEQTVEGIVIIDD